ncbi:hypothetical protein NPIL_206701 [Nephila pilipes]|uniref:Uncharacterized protein n=1 Tax=Nephila pilipes TaxID=299642 RepID=A0A8X6QBM6_NEPPI|nr:hypothetical protein NPIL_206701 [Nephila pilipes]
MVIGNNNINVTMENDKEKSENNLKNREIEYSIIGSHTDNSLQSIVNELNGEDLANISCQKDMVEIPINSIAHDTISIIDIEVT